MKTVPTVRRADSCDDGVFSELPEQVQLALTDFAGAAREGLLAMSVAAGLSVLQAMLEAEIAAACGPKGKHDPGRTAVRHGSGKGSVTLGGRRVPVARPRARTLDGREVALASYTHFAADDLLTEVVMERMLAGVATRRHARTAEPVGAQVGEEAKSTSRSAISRQFVKQTETALAELMARDLTGVRRSRRSCSMASTWPSGAWWWRWPSLPTAPRSRSGCGIAPPRTRPWSARRW